MTTHTEATSHLSPLMRVMQFAARKASRNLLRDFGELEHIQVSRKGPADFVSRADKKAEETIKNFGICEKNIHFVGSLGVDKIHKIKFLTASQLEHQLSFDSLWH